MSTDVVIHEQHGLALAPDQSEFTPMQVSILQQLGVKDATKGDMAVFHHVCQRTGLDPFARQIYMIGRNQKDGDRWVTKQTIQTGIDGYRLVARRAAKSAGESFEYEDNAWCGPDGQWTDVWLSDGPPAAAKVTVLRDGKRFPAVVRWSEYVQTTKSGDPTPMWKRMPANQLAKCAEAAALRKAFPQDLSGIYTDDEMAHPKTPQVEAPRGGPQRIRAIIEPEPDEQTWEEPPMTKAQRGRIFAQFAEMGVTDDQLMRDYMTNVLGRPVTEGEQGRASLTLVEAEKVIAAQQLDIPAQPEGETA